MPRPDDLIGPELQPPPRFAGRESLRTTLHARQRLRSTLTKQMPPRRYSTRQQRWLKCRNTPSGNQETELPRHVADL